MKWPVIITVNFAQGPNERQWVTLGLFMIILIMFLMAYDNPGLWNVELFKIIIQAVILTGLLNMVLAFHFAANKSDGDKTNNTGKAFDAITAVASNTTTAAEVATGKSNDPVHTVEEKKT